MKSKIRLLIIDVDGTMTDGGIYYDENGNELKKFCTKDAAGFFAARRVGIKIMVLTGRECSATARRMKDLKVDCLYQNVADKLSFIKKFAVENDYDYSEIGYIGDDLNDLPSMKISGFVGCPADSCTEVIGRADYVSKLNGGSGAVRDVIEYLLRSCGEWEKAISDIYGIGV